MRQPLCALPLIGQALPVTAPHLKEQQGWFPNRSKCIHRLRYIIKTCSRQPRTIFGAGIGQDPKWASTSKLKTVTSSSSQAPRQSQTSQDDPIKGLYSPGEIFSSN
jgi:hypothetical protein